MDAHKHHEELIQGLADQLKEILDTSRQAIYLYLDDAHKACNQNFSALLDYPSPIEWAAVTKPFPQVFVAEVSQPVLIDAYQMAMQQKIGSTFPVTWQKKTGDTVETTVILVPITFQDHLFAVHFIEKKGVNDMADTWKMLDCGKMPSEKNCQLKMMAPADQVEDLLDAGIAHAIKTHGHEETLELREQLRSAVEDAPSA